MLWCACYALSFNGLLPNSSRPMVFYLQQQPAAGRCASILPVVFMTSFLLFQYLRISCLLLRYHLLEIKVMGKFNRLTLTPVLMMYHPPSAALTTLTLILLLNNCQSYTMITSTHFQVLSAWSKAGIGTSIVLELLPAPGNEGHKKSLPRIALDMGATPTIDDAIPAKYVFLSHGHVDHVGAVFGHARAHSVAYGGYVYRPCCSWILCNNYSDDQSVQP